MVGRGRRNEGSFGEARGRRFYGPMRATVLSNADPDMLGRVKPQLAAVYGAAGEEEVPWAWPRGMRAGKDMGDFDPPAEGAPIYVEFLDGDPQYPIYTHGWWGSPDGQTMTPKEARRNPPTNAVLKSAAGHAFERDDAKASKGVRLTSADGHKLNLSDADQRTSLRSRAGHEVLLDDGRRFLSLKTKDGHEVLASDAQRLLRIKTKGGQVATFDDAQKRVVIEDSKGHKVTLEDAAGRITMTSPEGFTLMYDDNSRTFLVSAQTIQAQATQEVQVTAPTIDLAASTRISMEAPTIEITAATLLNVTAPVMLQMALMEVMATLLSKLQITGPNEIEITIDNAILDDPSRIPNATIKLKAGGASVTIERDTDASQEVTKSKVTIEADEFVAPGI